MITSEMRLAAKRQWLECEPRREQCIACDSFYYVSKQLKLQCWYKCPVCCAKK